MSKILSRLKLIPTRVTYELDKIHASYKELRFDKLIPCNCPDCKDSQQPYFYKFEALRNRLAKERLIKKLDISIIQCENSFDMVSVLGLIDDVMDRNQLAYTELETSKQHSSINLNVNVNTSSESKTMKYEETKVTGDQINASGVGNTVVNRSTVQNAFNKVKTEYDEETANALKRVEEEINKSGNKVAAENFEAFSEELSKPELKKSLLKTLWEGTLAALPTLAQLSSVVNLVVRLFS